MTETGREADDLEPAALLSGRTPEEQHEVLKRMTPPQKRELTERWWRWAHLGQYQPKGDWRVWLILAGRGFGKTRAGAEWLSAMARATPGGRFALVGGTADDVRRVMIEGEAGLMAVARDCEPVLFSRDRGEVIFASTAKAFVYSAEAPGALRGPEHHAAWCDELAKWRYNGAETWDNLMFGLRLGEPGRTLVTTTPKRSALLCEVEKQVEKEGVATRGRTYDNPHLPPSFVAAMVGRYGGTRLGRQEIDGEMLDDVAGALWTRAMIEACRAREPDGFVRVVVGLDPPAGVGHDACGIVAVGKGADGRAYVIEDASVVGATPEGWARAVAACAARVGADRVVAEANVIEVELAHDAMTLASADAGAVDRGGNLALVGGELLQFSTATQIAPKRWRLSGLLRGRRGMAAAHVAGERFVLLESAAAVSIALPPSMVGRNVRVMASGVGDTAGAAEAEAAITGVSIAPPSPVHLRAETLAGGDARVTWIRRSRIGWSWIDGVDAPLGEESERYRVTIAASGGAARTVVVTTPEVIVSAAERAGAVVSVRQLGTYAESRAAILALS